MCSTVSHAPLSSFKRLVGLCLLVFPLGKVINGVFTPMLVSQAENLEVRRKVPKCLEARGEVS